jgi:hypothetical protein
MRQRVWEATPVGLQEVPWDTDTTVPTGYGRQRRARKDTIRSTEARKAGSPF